MSDRVEPRQPLAGADQPTVRLKILRQESPEQRASRHVDTFEVPFHDAMTLADALLAIERGPVTFDGRQVTPVAWEGNCLEGVCGSCTMLVNGRVQQACTLPLAVASPKGKPIRVAPLGKFPLVRDLVVDRSSMFETLGRVHAFLEVESARASAPLQIAKPEQQELYALSRCTHCGACLEACPQFGESSDFVGAQALNQVRLFNLQPTGRLQAAERLESVMGPGGLRDCGKAQNCVEVCPVAVPLVDSIQRLDRDATKHMIHNWLLK